MAKDPKVDEYIAKAQPFAQPILNHIRTIVHKTIPEVEEKIKWGMPSFDYKGPFFSMAAFKAHAVLGFWKAPLMKDKELLLGNQESAMGHGGKLTSINDLPSDAQLKAWLLEAKKLNDDNVKMPAKDKVRIVAPDTPPEFEKAIQKNQAAKKVFEAFSPSQKKEYNLWILDAKTEATKQKRIATAVEWIADGKKRNWKYEKC